MNVIFTSLNKKEIINNRNIVYNNTKSLLKDVYNNIRIDFLKNNFRLDTSKYQNEVQSILNIIYKKLYNKNIKLTDSLKTLNNQPINIKDTQKEIIDNVIHSDIEKLMQAQSLQRSQLLLNGIQDASSKIVTESIKSYSNTITSVNNDINDLRANISQYPAILQSRQLNNDYTKLNDKISKLENQKNQIIQDRNSMIKNTVNNKFKDEIVNEKSTFHTLNEIDNFDSLQQSVESKTLDRFFKATLLTDTEDNTYITHENTKTWLNPLNKESRSWHASLHGHTILENELFELQHEGGTEYAYEPRADNLSAMNSVNCRCTLKRQKVFTQS